MLQSFSDSCLHIFTNGLFMFACQWRWPTGLKTRWASRFTKRLFRSSKHNVTDFVPMPSTQRRYCFGSIEGTGWWWRINLGSSKLYMFCCSSYHFFVLLCFFCSFFLSRCLSFNPERSYSWQFLRPHTIQDLASARNLTLIQLEVLPQKPCKFVILFPEGTQKH